MQIIRSLRQIKKFKDPVVTLGVFDGVHRGHRRILKAVVRQAKKIHGTSIAFTFSVHPQGKSYLYSLEHRLSLIEECGIAVCIVVNFSSAFSRLCAGDFVKKILVAKIGARYVYVGENFRFGKDARGNVTALKKLAKDYGFKLRVHKLVSKDAQAISSTYIRRLITKGNLKKAEEFLDHPVSVLGRVISGSALARKLGFPTANINPHHEILPPAGVYLAEVLLEKKRFKGICYIGSRPSLEKSLPKHVEVYIFNFRKDIYGKDLQIYFRKKLRNEKKFASLKDLAVQVKKDILKGQALTR